MMENESDESDFSNVYVPKYVAVLNTFECRKRNRHEDSLSYLPGARTNAGRLRRESETQRAEVEQKVYDLRTTNNMLTQPYMSKSTIKPSSQQAEILSHVVSSISRLSRPSHQKRTFRHRATGGRTTARSSFDHHRETIMSAIFRGVIGTSTSDSRISSVSSRGTEGEGPSGP